MALDVQIGTDIARDIRVFVDNRESFKITTHEFTQLKDIVASRYPKAGEFMEFNPSRTFNKVQQIYDVIVKENGATAEIKEAFNDTLEFIRVTHGLYSGELDFKETMGFSLENVEYSFAVPARGEKVEEAHVIPILKFLKPENNELHGRLFKELLAVLPPFILAVYEEVDVVPKIVGACIYTPQNIIEIEKTAEIGRELQDNLETLTELYKYAKKVTSPDNSRMNDEYSNVIVRNLNNFFKNISKPINGFRNELDAWGLMFSTSAKEPLQNLIVKVIKDPLNYLPMLIKGTQRVQFEIGQKSSASVNETISMIQRMTLGGIRHVGLGAILPVLTNLGRGIDKSLDVEPTTGHRMTIYGMYKTMDEILKLDGVLKEDEFDIGVVSAGYIGNSVAEITLANYPNSTIYIYDIKTDKAIKKAKALNRAYPGKNGDRVIVIDNPDELFNKTSRFYSAPTGKVELSPNINLNGKVIVDDSEPRSFIEEDVYAKGGAVIKPLFFTDSFKVHSTKGQNLNIIRRGVDYVQKRLSEYHFGWTPQNDGKFTTGLRGGTTFFGCELEAYFAYFISKLGLGGVDYEKEYGKNPILFAKPVKAGDLEELRIFESFLEKLINIDSMQGGGMLVGDRLRETSHIRNPKKFPNAA